MADSSYYVPESSRHPILASIGLFVMLFGLGMIFNSSSADGSTTVPIVVCSVGFAFFAYVLWGWFSDVISENHKGLNSMQLKDSYAMGMGWFIFSEVMFFAAFFGALFYVRSFVVPWLGGEGDKGSSHLLWSDFRAMWPPAANPDNGIFPAMSGVVHWNEIPLINTLLLLTSSFTVHFAHHALLHNERRKFQAWLGFTILLGAVFVYYQGAEYEHAWNDLSLTLNSGIYGSTFYMLTGFHGLHVSLGAIMLLIMLLRSFKGHFTADDHFGFAAASWYWHFVDVVWVGLFLFVYIL